MVRRVCMGNEAIALGALAAGLRLAAGYPGTPSTEIIETLVRERRAGVDVQWSVNEKAALEVAAGGAYAGARTMCTMKQVGLNVASDPLMRSPSRTTRGRGRRRRSRTRAASRSTRTSPSSTRRRPRKPTK